MWNRNFEVDSIAYYLSLLWNWFATDGLWEPQVLLMEPLIHDSVVLVLNVLQIEQNHFKASPYRYSELPNDGVGVACNWTGGCDWHMCMLCMLTLMAGSFQA